MRGGKKVCRRRTIVLYKHRVRGYPDIPHYNCVLTARKPRKPGISYGRTFSLLILKVVFVFENGIEICVFCFRNYFVFYYCVRCFTVSCWEYRLYGSYPPHAADPSMALHEVPEVPAARPLQPLADDEADLILRLLA